MKLDLDQADVLPIREDELRALLGRPCHWGGCDETAVAVAIEHSAFGMGYEPICHKHARHYGCVSLADLITAAGVPR